MLLLPYYVRCASLSTYCLNVTSAVCLLFVLMLLSQPSSAQTGSGLSEYPLGSGDKIKVQVFGEEELTVETILSDAGTLSYPFLGEIQVLGMTTTALEAYILNGLKGDYLVNPTVNVTIVEYRQFFINGEVEDSGGFPFQPGLTVRKAISLAGGFTERASKKNIFVISDSDTTQTPVRVELSTLIRPGDIVIVEQSFF